MQLWRLGVFAGLSLPGAVAPAAPTSFAPVPATPQLRGLGPQEANVLLSKLEEAQRALRAGEPLYFELLAGSIASYEMTKSSPREVFLGVPFRKIWQIERVGPVEKLNQRYRLSYAPNGLGNVYWEIDVSLMFEKRLTRVEMTYKPPAPF